MGASRRLWERELGVWKSVCHTTLHTHPLPPTHTRSYTTDFDEMEQLFSLDLNPDLQMEELEAMLAEFKQDYNQRHFVRNESFKKAADNVQGECGVGQGWGESCWVWGVV